MLKMVDGTGIIGVDMICPLGVSTPQPPNYDRVELEGAGMLVLPNSLDAPLDRLELGGKTEGKKQVITVGQIEQGTVTAHAGNNYPSDYRVRTKSYINLTSGVYEVMCTGAKLGNVIFYSAENKYEKMLSETHIPLPIKFTLEENKTVRILFSNSESTPIAPTDIKNAILEADVSPEHPQEIVNSGKWNEETQKYEVEVVLSGKNLLDITACEDGKVLDSYGNIVNSANGFLTDFIPCFANSPYCRSKKSFTTISFYDRDKNFISCINQYNDEFITPDECRYFRFSINKQDVDYTKAVANVGTALMDYEPYKKPQSLTLTSDRPITKWDRLVEQGGQIGWLYSTGVYEDIKESDISANGINDQYGRYYVNAIKAYKNAECMCNIAEYSPAQKENKCGFWWNDTPCFLISSEYTGNNGTEDNSTAIKNFKDNVLSKGITVFYKLNTEEFIPLPQSEQNAIRALETYYPTTVITADGGELDPDIKVTYRKEI